MDLNITPIPGQITEVTVSFKHNSDQEAHRLAQHLGVEAIVGADAAAHISLLRDTVREELALALEHRGMPRADMAPRVEQMLDAMGLQALAQRHPARLSGGQTRRLAIGAVAIAQPPQLIVVEPYAGLDPQSRQQVQAVLESLPQTAVIVVQGEHELADAPVAHPVPPTPGAEFAYGPLLGRRQAGRRRWWHLHAPQGADFSVGPVTLPLAPGAVTWLRGANGSGKTTLLRAAAGLDGAKAALDPSGQPPALALQSPMDQAIVPTISSLVGDAELVEALGLPGGDHPLDVSTAQLRVAQVAHAVVTARRQGREVVLLDEPDTLADAQGQRHIHQLISLAIREGRSVVLTTHDPGFAQRVSHYAPVREFTLEP
ncbi:ABC transporter [Corynebacterium lizhenjunii]|uniref:ABC transporter n=1 Tax=Corynebacterium lizhenjunii TaxID=2709394 RepID=A0A7T0KGL8_9CORY|nr:ATP-binding cassette domain-containing protein [Corynebacterium lizhenjunii]QPK80219.1 ABC transporter [Corynebacterium lizhenjunii]